MFRIDAQHSYAPPHQGPDWYGKILARNKFAGSVYMPHAGSLADALALAGEHGYIRRVVPRLDLLPLADVPAHPLIVSVYLPTPDARLLEQIAERGLAAELPAACWPIPTPPGLTVALDGIPEDCESLPPNIYCKLTGFRLPATPDQAERLRRALRAPGPERLMYASAWPYAGATWKETLAAFTQSLGPMPIPLREQLLGATAAAFYRI